MMTTMMMMTRMFKLQYVLCVTGRQKFQWEMIKSNISSWLVTWRQNSITDTEICSRCQLPSQASCSWPLWLGFSRASVSSFDPLLPFVYFFRFTTGFSTFPENLETWMTSLGKCKYGEEKFIS